MSRGLTVGQVSALSATNYKLANLVEIYTNGVANNSGAFFFTTGPNDVIVASAGGVGNMTYLADNGLSVVGIPRELYEPNVGEITVQLQVFYGSKLANASLTNTQMIENISTNFLKHRVMVSKLINSTPIQVFDGNVSGIDIVGTDSTMELNIRCTSLFTDFDKPRSRTTADLPGSQFNGNIYWGYLDAN